MVKLPQKGIVHRDLKSLNVLLDNNLLARICNFGISRFLAEREVSATKRIRTLHWMTPELFQSNHCTHKVQVSAVGILL
jgi:serine/threonine protein kinase